MASSSSTSDSSDEYVLEIVWARPSSHGREKLETFHFLREAIRQAMEDDQPKQKTQLQQHQPKQQLQQSQQMQQSQQTQQSQLTQQSQQQHQQSQLQQPAERSEVEKFEVNVKEGLEAYTLRNMVRAAGKYEMAIKLWKNNDSVKSFMDAEDMVVVRYAFGITAVSQTEIRSMIQEGLHMFQTMYKEGLHRTFPLVLYGLGHAFVALYRFAEATEVVRMEVTAAMKEALKPLCWPLSQRVIKESQLDVFLVEMEKLQEMCLYPPPPDALCFDHVDMEEGRAIYRACPTYGGQVTMSCNLRCVFMYHIACWKAYKARISQDKLSDKEVIDTDCPTPDCGSFICSVIVDKPGKAVVSFKSDQKPIPIRRTSTVPKMKPGQYTLALRQRRKDVRKQKKAEARQAAMTPDSPQHSQQPQDEVGEDFGDMEGGETLEGEQLEDDAALPSTDTMVVLSKEKEKEEELKYNTFQKTVKQKKKKEKKDKAVKVNVKLNFNDNPDRERVGGYDLEEEEEEEAEQLTLEAARSDDQRIMSAPVSSDQGVSEVLYVPAPPPRRPLEAFSKVVAASMPPQTPAQSRRDEDFKKSLTALLRDILKVEGPQRLGSILQRDVFLDISEEASQIIQQFGGLRQYFEKNYEFFVSGEFVGIRKDADKVQELAEHVAPLSAWSSNSVKSHPHPFLDSAGEPPVRTNFNPSEYNSDSADNREMTLPTIRQGLNPSAPEFQPKPMKSRMNEMDDFDLGPSPRGVAPTHRPSGGSGVDSLDSFSIAADDSDVEEGPVQGGSSAARPSLDVHDIDEMDLDPSASGSCPHLEDLNPAPAAQEGMSQRSSQSDLSQSGSDFSASMLFRTGSPSSSLSSHKNARDVSSPFSARDVNSPALSFPSRVAVDLTRQTGSPVSAAAVPPERVCLDKGQGSGLVSGSAPFFPSSGPTPSVDVASLDVKEDPGAGFSSSATTDIAHLTAGSLPPAPTPLKPIAPRFLAMASSHTGAIAITGSAGLSSGSAGLSSGSLSSGRIGGGGAGSVSSLPLGSDSVEVNRSVERTSDSPARALAADAAADVLSDSSASALTSSLTAQSLAFHPASSKGLGLLPSSVAGDYTSPFYLMQDTLLPDPSLATDYTPSTSLTLELAAPSRLAAGITSAPVTLSSSLTLSSALVDEFKPSSSAQPQTYSSSSLTWGAPLSSSLHSPFSSSPWTTGSAAREGGSWASDSFPSAVRPDEPTANPVLAFTAQHPGSSTTTSTYTIPYSNSSWSLASDSANRERDVAEKVDAGAQASVEMRSVVVGTDLTAQKIAELQSQEEAVQQFYKDHWQLMEQHEQLKKELAAVHEDRLALARQLEEQRNESQKALQSMVSLETETARLKEEQATRETQLMNELKNQQQQSAQSSMEKAGLLQEYAGLEEKLRSERSRAMQAEVRVIHEQTENFKLMLGSKIRDVERLTKEAPLLIQNWQRSNPGQAVPDQQAKDVMTYYHTAHKAFSHTLESVMGQLREQKDQILAGNILSDLPPVNATPALPKQPDCLQRMGPNGQLIFAPNMADVRSAVVSHPVASAAGGLQEMGASVSVSAMAPRTVGGAPPGVPPTPAPLRPPLPVLRPPGLGVPKLAGIPSTQQSAAPPPLRPISSLSRGLGGSLGRPAPPFASAARPEVRQPSPVEAAAAGGGKLSSYGRLLGVLQEGFPTVPRKMFQHCVIQLREANNGSLSGLKMPDIYQDIRAMLEKMGYTCRPDRLTLSTIVTNTTSNTNNSSGGGWEVRRTAPPPGLSAAWNVEGLEPTAGDTFVEEEDPCAICVEELSAGEVQTLECGHRFHNHCIRTWFRQQTTCPKCRSHAPLQDDFPALK